MANHLQTPESLAKTLKQLLKERKEEKKSIAKKAHETSTLLNSIIEGVNNGVRLFSAILTANKDLPIVGFALQMVAIIPQSIATLTDPKSPISTKIFSGVVLTAITALSIAAFVVGATTAAIIGLVIASITTVMQGLDFFGKLIEKMNATKTYEHLKKFEGLLKLGRENPENIPDGTDFNQDFAIRSVELDYVAGKRLAEIEQEQKIKKTQVNSYIDSKFEPKDIKLDELKKLKNQYKKPPANLLLEELIALEGEKLKIINELIFVKHVISKKNIVITDYKPAVKLKKLYDLHDEQLKELTQKIALINKNPQTTPDPTILDDILKLQKKIGETNKKIDELIKPARATKLAHLKGNENLAQSYTNLALSSTGIVLSVMALLLIIGTVAAPPFVLPVVVGFGIGIAAFSLIKWVAEKYAEVEDLDIKTKKEEGQEDSILNEAIDCYQHQQNKEFSHTGFCSYSKHMSELLKTPLPVPETQVNHTLVSQDFSKAPFVTKDLPVSTLDEKTQTIDNSVISNSGTAKL